MISTTTAGRRALANRLRTTAAEFDRSSSGIRRRVARPAPRGTAPRVRQRLSRPLLLWIVVVLLLYAA